jgi:DNA-binding MarR family transcriptional regulator
MCGDQTRDGNLLFEMLDCARVLRTHLEARLAAHQRGLTFGDAQALVLVAYGASLQQNRVATRLRINRPTATEAINRLEKLGLAERRRVSTDLRTRYIDVTDLGSDLSNAITDEVSCLEEAFSANFPSAELNGVRSALLRMRDSLIRDGD